MKAKQTLVMGIILMTLAACFSPWTGEEGGAQAGLYSVRIVGGAAGSALAVERNGQYQ